MCTPEAEQESIFRTFLLGGGDLEVYLLVDLDRFHRLFRGRRLKKVVNIFEEKNCTHRQNPGYAYVRGGSRGVDVRSLFLTR